MSLLRICFTSKTLSIKTPKPQNPKTPFYVKIIIRINIKMQGTSGRMPMTAMAIDWDVGEDYECLRFLGKGGWG